MNIFCPHCHSSHVRCPNHARKTGAAIGILAGMSAGLLGATGGAELGLPIGMEVGLLLGPPGVIAGGIAGAILGALVGGFSGYIAGAKLGDVIDEHILMPFLCDDCGKRFSDPMTMTSAADMSEPFLPE